MEFLSDYNYRLSYRRGRRNTNANLFSQLPLPSSSVEDISDSSALSDPDDLGAYVIRACDYPAPPCPPKRWPGWTGPLVGYSGLGWATPDERRLKRKKWLPTSVTLLSTLNSHSLLLPSLSGPQAAPFNIIISFLHPKTLHRVCSVGSTPTSALAFAANLSLSQGHL